MLPFSSVRNFSWGALQDFGSRVVRGVLENNLFSRVCGVGRSILESRVSNALWNHKVTLLAAGAAGGLGFVWGRSFAAAAGRDERSALARESRQSELEEQLLEVQRGERALQESMEKWLPFIESAEQRLIAFMQTGNASLAQEERCDLSPRSAGTSQNPSPGRGGDAPKMEEFLERLGLIVQMAVEGFPKLSEERGAAFERPLELANEGDKAAHLDLRTCFQARIETYLPYLKRMESKIIPIYPSSGSLPKQEALGTSQNPSPDRGGDAPKIEDFLKRLEWVIQLAVERATKPSEMENEDDEMAQVSKYCQFTINTYFAYLKRMESKMATIQPSSVGLAEQDAVPQLEDFLDRLDALFYSAGRKILGNAFAIGLSRESSPDAK
jgi:hypothetical protein